MYVTRVPLVGGLPDAGDGGMQVLRDHFVVQRLDPEAGSVAEGDEAVVDDRLRGAA